MPASFSSSMARRLGPTSMPTRTVAWLYDCASASISRTLPWLRPSELSGLQRLPLPSVTVTDESSTQLASDHWLGEASRSEEHTSELQSLMRISYAVFCLKKKK